MSEIDTSAGLVLTPRNEAPGLMKTDDPQAGNTAVSIKGEHWQINGSPVAQGSKSEGLLLNARLIQAIFDDRNNSTRHNWKYPDTGVWDAERNVDEFIGNLSTWYAAGLRSFTVGLQGGSPHCCEISASDQRSYDYDLDLPSCLALETVPMNRSMHSLLIRCAMLRRW